MWFDACISIVKWLAATFVVLSSALYMLGGLRPGGQCHPALAPNWIVRREGGGAAESMEFLKPWHVACVPFAKRVPNTVGKLDAMLRATLSHPGGGDTPPT